ncbi:MAG: Rrf2 family transcriptional regulator [Elusimicrobiota bacterium]
MRITFKGDYALKILLDLSLNYPDKKVGINSVEFVSLGSKYSIGLVQIKDISKRQDIPVKYLEQIILILKGAGYVRSKRGPVGGVYLAKPPEKIKVGEIVRLMEGSTSPITCVSRTEPSKCNFIRRCPFVEMWTEIRDLTNKIIDGTTFADISEKVKSTSIKSTDYSI